ncbi:MAG: MerR family transcriptional regulator [Actinobacteria bacterium]|nr:MerR family transcriptional regulator [Actinomycetota bacterium]
MASATTPKRAAKDADALTINEAAETSGWSARMLRYIENAGLVEPPRSPAGYRLYGPGELQRLRTLRELLNSHDLEISNVGFARRLRKEPQLGHAVNLWLDQTPERPAEVADADWLSWEQRKHKKLLEAAA